MGFVPRLLVGPHLLKATRIHVPSSDMHETIYVFHMDGYFTQMRNQMLVTRLDIQFHNQVPQCIIHKAQLPCCATEHVD